MVKMTRERLLQPLVLGAAGLVLVVAAACGDDETANGVDDGLGTTPAPATEATPAVTEPPATTPTPAATDPGDNGDAQAGLEALSGMFENATFAVTYQMSSTIEGEELDGEWTWYVDAAGERMRFDITDVDESIPGQVTVITTATETIICFEGNCLGADMPGMADPSAELFDQIDSLDEYAMDGTVRSAGTRDVAGTEAMCFEFENPDVTVETGLMCFSSEGVPLLAEWESPEGMFSMQATSYSSSVSDADFEPPFPVMGIPSN